MQASFPTFSLPYERGSLPGSSQCRRLLPLCLSLLAHLSVLGCILLSFSGGKLAGQQEGGGIGQGNVMFISDFVSLGQQDASTGEILQEKPSYSHSDDGLKPKETKPKGEEQKAPRDTIRIKNPAAIPILAEKTKESPGAIPPEVFPRQQSPVQDEASQLKPQSTRTPETAATAPITSSGGGGGNTGTGAAASGNDAIQGEGGSTQLSGGNEEFFWARVDEVPKILSRSRVEYPDWARKKRITGHVLLRFGLTEHGEILNIHVIESNPPGVFDEVAIASVKNWKFSPARKEGKPVPYLVNLPMPFVLR